ncbi:hypothetical protein NITLEN_40307 [Nitrospira lenta]|uniref:Uncharacterized protein n=1 Tax=Nitrospira lenta TaxID=1436998 RepID=A0A330LAC0_9BACT|nr:hypothetical protein NITLEN_40307 [Nitrospira lenta]
MTTTQVSPIHRDRPISAQIRVIDTALRVLHTITSTIATALSGATLSNTLGLGAGASS